MMCEVGNPVHVGPGHEPDTNSDDEDDDMRRVDNCDSCKPALQMVMVFVEVDIR